MKPYLFGLQTYFMAWVVAGVVGIWTGMRLARRHGLPLRQCFWALVACSVTILIGSKLLYLAEHALYPLDDPDPMLQAQVAGFAWHGFRIPGGMLLLTLVLPVLCRAFGLPTLKFADATVPAAAISTGCIRIGCFLNGCCFGRLTNGPFGLSFPRGSRVWEWQYVHGYLAATAPQTLPVVPLQLYFAGVGFALYGLAQYWQKHRHVDGQVWAQFCLVFFGATFVLEFFRSTVFHLNLILTAAAVALSALAAHRFRAAARRASGIGSSGVARPM
jgi:phosphatidylglycerol---prolipoprotein diacylglyceryl transferase